MYRGIVIYLVAKIGLWLLLREWLKREIKRRGLEEKVRELRDSKI